MNADKLRPALLRLIAGSVVVCCSVATHADNWSGSVRTKLQTDNRYNKAGDYTGEIWGQFAYVNPDYDFNARFSTINRFSTDIYRNRQDVYQAYLEKKVTALSLPFTLRGGRFERADSLGLYLLDGGALQLKLPDTPLSFDVYAGIPTRLDHVRSLDANFIAGAESLLQLTPNWSLLDQNLQIDRFDLRVGLQLMQGNISVLQTQTIGDSVITGNQFDADESAAPTLRTERRNTYRIHSSARFAGHLLSAGRPFEIALQSSFAAEKQRFENVLVDAWWDVLPKLRLRNYYEAYRPKQPFITFRDRFYSAYALGEQRIWRGSGQYKQNDKLSYNLGLQVASRDQGYNGEGFNAGFSYRWEPALLVRGEFDHLALDSDESADSLYLSMSHAFSAKARYGVNLAWRFENKALYGANQARGIENEWQYMLDNSLVVGFSGSYVDNTSLRSEYLAAMQLTYYFDRFQPRKP